MSLKVRVASLLEIQIVVMNFPEVVDLILRKKLEELLSPSKDINHPFHLRKIHPVCAASKRFLSAGLSPLAVTEQGPE